MPHYLVARTEGGQILAVARFIDDLQDERYDAAADRALQRFAHEYPGYDVGLWTLEKAPLTGPNLANGAIYRASEFLL